MKLMYVLLIGICCFTMHGYAECQRCISGCPCIQKTDGAVCACIERYGVCNCAQQYAKQEGAPVCPCVSDVKAERQAQQGRVVDSVRIDVPHGELFDKITILEIKAKNITDVQKLAYITRELAILNEALVTVLKQHVDHIEDLMDLKQRLYTINETLWDIEDALRAKEEHEEFDGEFIELARAVYINNDERATIKRMISELLSSHIIEVKSYV